MKRVQPGGAVVLSPALVTRARQRAQLLCGLMQRVGFSADVVAELLGLPDPRLTSDEQAALWSWRSRGPDPLAVVVRLFVLGQTAARKEIAPLWGAGFAAAVRAGLLHQAPGQQMRAGLSLSIHEGRLIFADPPRARPGREHVLGPTRATFVLDQALPRPAAAGGEVFPRALELGTGTGYLALRLAQVAGLVTATDVSSHALALAVLNAALAGPPADQIEWRLSDRWAALGRRKFDLVVGNLPFVIAPERQFVYRDGGLAEDGFVASVIGGVGRHLVEGGIAVVLGQWIHREGEPEDERLAPWFVAAGCDAIVYRLDAEPADVYAARWSAGPGSDLTPRERTQKLERWLLGLRRSRVQGISTGLFVLRRRRADRHFMSIDDVAATAAAPTWATITADLAALDRPGR